MFKEFKDFAMKGNVLDMAIGVILGAAFGKVVSSFVADVMMPPLGRLIGGVDFSSLFINLSGTPYESLDAAKKAGAATLNYGVFINTFIDFVIVAFAIFLVVKAVNKMRQAPAAAAPTTKDCPYCQMSVPLSAVKCGHCTSALPAK